MRQTCDAKLPAGTRAWIISDGKIGDEAQCFGIIEALGLTAERRVVTPRKIFSWAMPWGPIDPREAKGKTNNPLTGPWPDIAIAAGRRCVPYLRYVKRQSRNATFTVFVKDPYCRRNGADLIWVPQHDRLRGSNIIATLTPANRLRTDVMEAARSRPDARIASLPQPRIAVILGGPSKHHAFGAKEERELTQIALGIMRGGASLMVTGSRRTPASLLAAVRKAASDDDEFAPRLFLWSGDGENPYVDMLANADAIIVTGDSVNMVGESLAAGVPVHVYEPTGGHRKFTAYIDALVERGAVRRWQGHLEDWISEPINATPKIAAEVARRYREFRSKKNFHDISAQNHLRD
jgi:uncharacterized protein